MSRELDKYTANLTALDNALRTSGQDGILSQMGITVGELLKTLATNNIDLSAKCIRPAEVAEVTE